MQFCYCHTLAKFFFKNNWKKEKIATQVHILEEFLHKKPVFSHQKQDVLINVLAGADPRGFYSDPTFEKKTDMTFEKKPGGANITLSAFCSSSL